MEAERDKGLTVNKATEIARKFLAPHRWTGTIVARDKELRGGIGRVLGEPDEQGIAWVYWGTNDHQKYESREVVVEMVRLDLNDDFMANYRRHKDDE